MRVIVPECSGATSKRVLQRELENAGADVTQDLAERRIREIVIRGQEIGVVQQVEKFEPQFYALALRDVYEPTHRRVDVDVPGRLHRTPSRTAKRASRAKSETTGVEPLK